jgi:signal transduction histidine kinase
LIYSILVKCGKLIKIICSSGPLYVRMAALIIAAEIAVFIITAIFILSIDSVGRLFGLILLAGLSIWGIYYLIRKTKPFVDISNGVKEIKDGKLDYVIDVPGDGALARLARDINDIAQGLKNSVAKEMKAEKMKTELITNVSHDLKTPLTSIINYVDLLSKEKLAPDVANEYVGVLKQKSEKLKLLTQDLFEISKVQSGNITIDAEKINISVLVKQSIAEFDEQISKSGLDFKVSIKEDNAFVMADGKLLSRAIENLVGNILKYAMENTRVYVDVSADEFDVTLDFKNIANYEMNFAEGEVLERFVRGDKARTTDGNGLGLAIAQSYVVACGGTFKISVDGDLFKAIIKFKKA